jgi:hypothetical protein
MLNPRLHDLLIADIERLLQKPQGHHNPDWDRRMTDVGTETAKLDLELLPLRALSSFHQLVIWIRHQFQRFGANVYECIKVNHRPCPGLCV